MVLPRAVNPLAELSDGMFAFPRSAGADAVKQCQHFIELLVFHGSLRNGAMKGQEGDTADFAF